MTRHPDHTRSTCWALFTLLVVASPAFSYVDPPARVARLSYVRGDVSFQPGGEDDWVWASINRPLTTGDGLWTDYASRAELDLGSVVIRVDEQSDVSFLDVDDDALQIQLNAGSLNVRLHHLFPNEVVEIDTPNVAVTLLRPGTYRIDADAYGEFTSVMVREGQIQIDGGRRAYYVDAGSEVQAQGTDRVDYLFYDLPPADEFDQWARSRDRRDDLAQSTRYVSRDVIGYQDLDEYGSWTVDARLGPVWIPAHVSRDWAPFRDGSWVWIDPWGWTWVDEAPWGFATSHYGRWTYLPRGATWCWIPPQQGPSRRPSGRGVYAVSYAERPFYSPANVTFLGGSIQLGNVGVAWFALGPGEVYVPAYQASSTYINQVNVTNTNVQVTYVNTVVNNQERVAHVNRRVPGAVVAVPRNVFVSAEPVANSVVNVSLAVAEEASPVRVAPIAPERASVLGRANRRAQGRAAADSAGASVGANAPQPPAIVESRTVVAKQTPPPARVPFARKQRAMAADPGKPLDRQAEQQLAAAAAPPPVVKAEPATAAQAAAEPNEKPRPAAERRTTRRLLHQPSAQAGAVAATPPAARQDADEPRAEQATQEQAGKGQRATARQEAERARAEQAAKQDAERNRAQQEERAHREQAAKQEEEKTPAPQSPTSQEQPGRRGAEGARGRQGRREPQNSQQEAAQATPSPSARGSLTTPAAPVGNARMRVPESTQAAKLVLQPPLNKPAGAQGTVRLRALIGADGRVKNVVVLGGPKPLQAAALENARQRVYQPTIQGGRPVEVETEISIRFS
jgi:hypothetical protein